jgi:hypothetical protein
MFGGKLAKEVFGAKGSSGFFKVKGHGSSLDVRLLKLKSMAIKKKQWNLKPARGFKGAIVKKRRKITKKKNQETNV